MCSKHVEAYNELIVKQKFCASSWLITEINTLGSWKHIEDSIVKLKHYCKLCAVCWFLLHRYMHYFRLYNFEVFALKKETARLSETPFAIDLSMRRTVMLCVLLKHLEACNILIVKQKFCASSLLITKINRLF